MALPSFRATELRRREQASSIQAAWNFDEAAGTTAKDVTGYGKDITIDPGFTWPAGHSGTAISNTSSGNAVVSWTLTSGNITLMGWARPLDLTLGTNRPLFGIWDTPDSTGSTHAVIWAQRSDFGTADVLQGNIRVNGSLVSVASTALTPNTWVHLALTYDGTTIRLYKNGIEVATNASAGTIFLGSLNFCVVPSPANAQADDVRVFGTALTQSQIVDYMNTPVAAP